MGYFLSAGGTAGLWAKLMEMPQIEAIHLKCQGRGDTECITICADPEKLKKYGGELYTETDIDGLGVNQNYRSINTTQKTKYGTKSFQDFLKSNLFKYEKGMVTRGTERYFVVESSALYLIEKELQVDASAMNVLYDASFETGFELVQSLKIDTLSGITEFMTACGWGDVMILQKRGKMQAIIQYYPWNRFSEDIKFIVCKAFLEGMISGVLTKTIHLELISKKVNKGGLTLNFSEV